MLEMFESQTGSPELSLANSISDTDTIIQLNEDITLLPSAPNIVTIYTADSFETILYESVNTVDDQLETVTRAFEGVAQSWSAGTSIARLLANYDTEAFKNNINELSVNLGGYEIQKDGTDASGIINFKTS